MKTVLSLGVMAGVAAAGAAIADTVDDGVYGSLKGGATWQDDQSYDGAGLTGVETKFDRGRIGTAAIGVRSGPMRYELEGVHSESDVKSQNAGGGSVTGGGKSRLTAGMANVYVDLGTYVGVKPYIGGGAGYGRVKVDNYTVGGVTAVNGKDDVLAYQGMAGVSYDITPKLAVTGEYRYVGTNDATVDGPFGPSKVSYDSNNVLVGLRYTF